MFNFKTSPAAFSSWRRWFPFAWGHHPPQLVFPIATELLNLGSRKITGERWVGWMGTLVGHRKIGRNVNEGNEAQLGLASTFLVTLFDLLMKVKVWL